MLVWAGGGKATLVVLTAEWYGFVGAGEEAWLEVQQELAGLSSNGTQITVEGTGHDLAGFKSTLQPHPHPARQP